MAVVKTATDNFLYYLYVFIIKLYEFLFQLLRFVPKEIEILNT